MRLYLCTSGKLPTTRDHTRSTGGQTRGLDQQGPNKGTRSTGAKQETWGQTRGLN